MKGTFRRARLGRLLLVAAMLVAAALVGAGTASADGTTVSTTTPMTFSDVNPCTMEAFVGTGNFHFLETGSVSLDGKVHWHSVYDLNGMQATTVTGKKYTVKVDELQTYGFDSDLAPYHVTQDWDVHFIRQGEDGNFVLGDDFHSHILAHTTINANGVVTVDDYSENTYCN